MKYFILKSCNIPFYIAILAGSFFLRGQPPQIEWQNRFGGANWQVSYGSQQTLDGGFIIGGRSDSNISFDKTENSKGNYDYWILKTDQGGAIVWDKTIGAASPFDNEDIFRSIFQTTDGGYIISGYSNSPMSGDKSEDAFEISDDFWIVKTDMMGNVEWDNTIGGNEADQPTSIISTSDGGYIIAGSSSSPISGDKNEECRGLKDFWVLKLNNTGSIQWQKTIGGSENDGIASIVQTVDNGYLLTGSSSSGISGDKTEDSRGLSDFWVVRIDSIGNVIWQKTIGGSGSDGIYKALGTSDGGFFLSGVSNSPISGEKTLPSKGMNDFWIVKIDENGNIEWQNVFGGSSTDSLFSAAQCLDGGFILTGTSDSPVSGDKTEPLMGIRDAWIVRTDSFGNLLWQKTLGGNLEDGFNSVHQTTDGGFFLSGGTNSQISGNIIHNPKGIIDYWIVKLFPENLSNKNFTNLNFNIYPNPTEKDLHIDLPTVYQSINISITDITGKLIQKQQFQNTSQINLELNSATGLYFLEIASESQKRVFKIIKE